MTFAEMFKAIVTSPAVWSAMLLLIHLVVTRYVPDMPKDILGAIEGLLIAILAAIGIGGVVVKARTAATVNALRTAYQNDHAAVRSLIAALNDAWAKDPAKKL